MDSIIVNCPNCKDIIYINIKELNCHIFRHGIYKNNYKQINPHLNKIDCDRLFNENLIYGCGKPFKIIIENHKYKSVICDYI
jgi:hypothetical protein